MCCQVHDNCYTQASTLTKCSPHLVFYLHINLICVTNQSDCALETCICDTEFIQCIQSLSTTIIPTNLLKPAIYIG